MSNSALDLLADWVVAEREARITQQREKDLRAAVVEAFFGKDVKKGTHRIELPSGHRLKLTARENVTLAKREVVEDALKKIERHEAGGEFIAENLIRWKPELDSKIYASIPDKIRKIIDGVITRKPGSPSIEVEDPK